MFTRILILAVVVIALVSGMAFFVRQQNAGAPEVALTDDQQEEIARILDGQEPVNKNEDSTDILNADLQEDLTADAEGSVGEEESDEATDSSGEIMPETDLPSQPTPTVAGTSTTGSFVARAQASTPARGSWELIAFDRKKWDIDDEDDKYSEIRYKRDVCDDVKDSARVPVECRKTSKLKRDSARSLGEDKCSNSCTVGESCVLWNSDEKRDGSLTLNVANYMCS